MFDTKDTINFIANRLKLKPDQIEELSKVPDVCWLKCNQAIKIANHRGYQLDIIMDGLIKNKPNPKVDFIHTYDIYHKNKSYRHSINIEIRI